MYLISNHAHCKDLHMHNEMLETGTKYYKRVRNHLSFAKIWLNNMTSMPSLETLKDT